MVSVRHPFDGREIGRTSNATPEQVEQAVAAAVEVADAAAALPAYVRAGALDQVSRRLAERAEEIARLITGESGKPLKWARAEVGRAVSTFRWAAEEARRFSGELQRLDTDPASVGRLALVRRVSRGPVLGITPFNFPLNLVAHKVAPALAVGAPIVVKPAPATPLTALLLGELLAEVTEPDGPGPGCRLGCSPYCRCRTTGRSNWSATRAYRWSPSPDQDRSARPSSTPYPENTSPSNSAATPRWCSAPTGPPMRISTGRRSGSPPSPTTRPVRVASRCSGSMSTNGCSTGSCPGWSPPSRRCGPVTRSTRQPTSGR